MTREAHAVGARVTVVGVDATDGTLTATVAARKGDAARGAIKYYVRYDDEARPEWVTGDRVRDRAPESRTQSAATTGGKEGSIARDEDDGGTNGARGGARGRANGGGRVDKASASDAHGKVKPTRRVKFIELGRYVCDCWYDSPFPEEFTDGEKLFVCDFCFKYHRKRKAYIAHKRTCELRRPPGNEVYRHPAQPAANGRAARGQLRMFEIDGSNATTYCQNLCLIAKLFLDSKMLYYDVGAFYFYVLTEQDFNQEGKPLYRIVGYFSKEKGQVETNLACILTLPPYQRRGYGLFLIEFSYELSRREGRIGTPERPLSDLGSVSYTAYWNRALSEDLDDFVGEISIAELSKRTNIVASDIVTTFEHNSLVRVSEDQSSVEITKEYAAETAALQLQLRNNDSLRVIPENLRWEPHTSSVVEVAEKRRRTRLFQSAENS